MIKLHPKVEDIYRTESNFEIFKSSGLLCCVQRVSYGHFCGYVAIEEGHPLFGKDYSDSIMLEEEPEFNNNYLGLLSMAMKEDRKDNEYPIDLALTVHGGITYARDTLNGLDNSIFNNLWWFGFDTAHAGDLRPFQDEIDLKYEFNHEEDIYKGFDFTKKEVEKLASQLSKMKK